MKTIKEAAHEYFRRAQLHLAPAGSEYGFVAGVEFAQQWIDAEINPPKNSEPVLGRYEQCIPEVCEYFNVIKEWINSESRDITTVTHWRPIDIK